MNILKSITSKTKEFLKIPDREKLSIQVIEKMTTQELLTKYKEIVEQNTNRKKLQITYLNKSKYHLLFAIISLYPIAMIGYATWWKIAICAVCIILFINFLVNSIKYTSQSNSLQKNEDNLKFELTAVQFHLEQHDLKNQRLSKNQSLDEVESGVEKDSEKE